MIYVRAVYNQKAVVAVFIDTDFYRLILTVVLFQILSKLTAYRLSIDFCGHARRTLSEHKKNGLVDIIVYQKNGLPGRLYQI